MLLLITNFTSLKNIEIKSINEELQLMNILIDQKILKVIVNKMEEHCAEEIKNFNEAIFDIMQEKMDSLKQQEEFMRVLNEEIKKNEIGLSEGLVDVDGENVNINDDTDKTDELVNKIEITDTE